MTSAYEERHLLERDALDELLDAIRRRGFRLVGPVLRDGAICYDDLASSADLPAGWTDEQDGGTYRVRRREDDALIGYNVGPQSWKKYLFPHGGAVRTTARSRYRQWMTHKLATWEDQFGTSGCVGCGRASPGAR